MIRLLTSTFLQPALNDPGSLPLIQSLIRLKILFQACSEHE